MLMTTYSFPFILLQLVLRSIQNQHYLVCLQDLYLNYLNTDHKRKVSSFRTADSCEALANT
jgi:hypothetical protein